MEPPPFPPVRCKADGTRLRPLCQTESFDAALVYYAPGIVQRCHEHDRAQLSFLLCGGFAEQAEGIESMPLGPRHCFKPQGARHATDFGWSGALILSIDFADAAHWNRTSSAATGLSPARLHAMLAA